MKAITILVLLLALGFCVVNVNAAEVDQILFGSNAGRESGDAPPGPYTSAHQLVHDGQGTIGGAVYMDRLYQNFDWVMAAPAGGGTVTLTTEYWHGADIGGTGYGPGVQIYTEDIMPVYTGDYTPFTAEYNPAHPEYRDSVTFDVMFDDPYIGVRRDWQPYGNKQIGLYNSTLTSDVTPLAAGSYDMVDFGNGARLGQAASSSAHSVDTTGNLHADRVGFNGLGQRIDWYFTVATDGLYTPQFHALDKDSAPGWGIAAFSWDVDGDGFENHEILDPIAVDTATAIKTFGDIYLTAGSHKFIVLSQFGDNAYSNAYGAQLVLVPEPITMLLLGSGALLALRRRRS